MLRPVIMIGCGGAGNQIVRYTRDAVERRLKNVGWNGGIPRAWQFIGIDSSRFQPVGEVPYLPNSDYLDISVQDVTYQQFDMALQARFGPHDAQPSVFRELMGWRPNPNQIAVPIQFGSGWIRPIGRALGLISLQHHVRDRIQYAFSACVAGGPELVAVTRGLGGVVPPEQSVPQPIVMVIGSMAGGTGSGIMLDVVELIRKTDVNGQFPTLIALSPDVFESYVSGSSQSDRLNANSASFMAELLNAYWDNEIPAHGLIPPMVLTHRRGPHSVYVIGRRNLDGHDLVSSRNVFVAVSKTLAAITTSERVQQDFVHYQTVDWTNRAAANAGGYGFASQSLPAVSSSFGSATISIGREHFREYLKKLLLRSIVEKLSMGLNDVASMVFGEDKPTSITTAEKVDELERKNLEKFIDDCGLGIEQLKEFFLSTETMRSQLAEVSQAIRNTLPSSVNQRSDVWRQLILTAADEHRSSTRRAIAAEVEQKIQLWSTDLYKQVLVVVSDFVGRMSIPIAISTIESAKAEVIKTAVEIRENARNSREYSHRAIHSAANLFSLNRPRLNFDSARVKEAVTEVSKSFVWGWRAEVEEILASNLESIAAQMFSTIEASLRQTNYRLSEVAEWKTTDWPRVDGEVPVSFAPSRIEFLLEDHSTWPQQAKGLIKQSFGHGQGLPIDPIDAARVLIIRGGFEDPTRGQTVTPFVWVDDHVNDPIWKPGMSISMKVDDSLNELSARVDAWLSRPESELHQMLNEGLSAYLSPTNPTNGEPIENHSVRLMRYFEGLQRALMDCRPLLEVHHVMNATVHPHEILCTLGIDGFPFQVGHPARQLTEQVIQGFLGTTDPVDWAFSSSDSESVTITSFLKYPVNPSVIRSATEPLERTRSGITNPSQHFHMWQWTRSRPLRQFVPLPQELILSAIRGFAVARALGVVSAEVEDQNVIAIHSGEVKFPEFLLTLTDRNNLLSSLLESMVLAFGDIPTMGSAAFDAYEALISYGSSEGQSSEFQVGGLLRHFLETGDYDGVKVVDHRRAESVFGDDRHKRAEKILEYLERNIERFEHLERTGPDSRSWRNSIGTVEPTDTLTQELLPELRRGYGQVLDAVRNWQRPSDYLV